MSKWRHREEGKAISKALLKDMSLKELRESKDFISNFLDLRKAQKLEQTYIRGTTNAIDYNGKDKVYVDYRFDGTATGRLSCAAYTAEKAMGVSFHTLPRETKNNIRSIFVPPEDHAFVTIDYSTMELRVLAHLSREQGMIDAFNSGQDLHSYTGSLLFNKSIDEVTKQERQLAKTVSFLIVYGGGAFNLSETMGISIKRAEGVVNSYKEVYPRVFRFMDYVHNFVRENEYAYTIFGRRRNLNDISSKDKGVQHRSLRQGFNFIVQSTSSDILLFALLGLSQHYKAVNMKSKVVSTVHDSLELVVPYDELERAVTLAKIHMVECPHLKSIFDVNFLVPFEIETIVGKSFGDGMEVEYAEGSVSNLQEIERSLGHA